jgi:type II secretory pathway component HofQ
LALSVNLLSTVNAGNNSALTTKIDLSAPIDFQEAGNRISIDDDEISLRRVLRLIGNRANLNMILDKSVQGVISISLNEVTVKEALEYVRNLSGLYYQNKGDNILLVTTKEAAVEKGLTKNISKIVPVRYVNAKLISALLNSTIFSASGASGGAPGSAVNASKKATPEFRTNSVILVGNDNDIRLAEELIDRIDIPRETKTFKINNAQVYEVAQMLQASVFNDGVTPFNGSSAGAGSSDITTAPSGVDVAVETFEEGSGSSNEVQSASGSAGGGSQQTFTLRASKMVNQNVKISPDGPIIVPDSRTNTITLMGTIEQIALAESVIPSLDQKLPQVAIETSLVEIYENGTRMMQPMIGSQDGQFKFGFDNTANATTDAEAPVAGGINVPLGGLFGLPTVVDRGAETTAFQWSTVPLTRSSQVLAQINAIIGAKKGRILANPTVIAVHNTEAVISITEEVVKAVVTTVVNGIPQSQVELGEAGIILNILPKITGDGYVVLRVRPSVSTIAGQLKDPEGNVITLLNKRDFAVQETRVANGQTLSLGGLIQEKSRNDSGRIPMLANLPVLGALFKTSYTDNSRSELMMLVTPRIMEDSSPIISSRISSLMNDPEFKSVMNNAKHRFNK